MTLVNPLSADVLYVCPVVNMLACSDCSPRTGQIIKNHLVFLKEKICYKMV